MLKVNLQFNYVPKFGNKNISVESVLKDVIVNVYNTPDRTTIELQDSRTLQLFSMCFDSDSNLSVRMGVDKLIDNLTEAIRDKENNYELYIRKADIENNSFELKLNRIVSICGSKHVSKSIEVVMNPVYHFVGHSDSDYTEICS